MGASGMKQTFDHLKNNLTANLHKELEVASRLVTIQINQIHNEYEKRLENVQKDKTVLLKFEDQIKQQQEVQLLYSDHIKFCHHLLDHSKQTDCWEEAISLLKRAIALNNDECLLLLLETIARIKEIDQKSLKVLIGLSIDAIVHDNNVPKDQVVYQMLKMVHSSAEKKVHKQTLQECIATRIEQLDSNIYERGSLPLLLEFYKTCIMLDFDNLFVESFKDMLVDWDVLFGEVLSEDYAIKMLWYGLLANKVDTIISFSDRHSILEDKSIADIDSFHNAMNLLERWNGKSTRIYQIINSLVTFNHVEKEKFRRFIYQKGLALIEKEALKERQEKEKQEKEKLAKEKQEKKKQEKAKEEKEKLAKEIVAKHSSTQIRKLGRVTKLSANELRSSKYAHLTEEVIDLVVYTNSYEKNLKGYLRFTVLSDNGTGVAYINDDHLTLIRSSSKNNYVEVLNDTSYKVITKHSVDTNKKSTKETSSIVHFAWPSTEITGNYQPEEDGQMKRESDLKKMGYQITGISAEKRWTILQQAVPAIGLKSIAYTIAHNVKLRKGQKGGKKKFKYSISEWEKDLAKLKKTYYKNDFTWPSL